ncbi:MAG: efflux transporter outer membrane subunit [Planctomycetota bacterium]
MAIAVCLFAGCTSTRQWWQNGLKVGPNYGRPPAPVADEWIDAGDPNVKSEATDYSYWWTVFNDPVLNELIYTAYEQNLPLKKAGLRILEARAQRGIAAGNLFPQQQRMTGAYSRNKFSDNSFPFGAFPGNREFDEWTVGFDAAWELDIWGRIRRGIEAADANLNAQIEDYDDVLVILQAEVAAAYIQMRTLEERLVLVRKNIALQKEALVIIERRFQGGVVSEIDVRQAKAILAITESLVPALEENRRKVQNALCILLGIPLRNLQEELGQPQPIPTAPPQVVVGIPAELLRRRPDVRRAEREAAVQSARIGIAASEFYPRIGISGMISLDAEQFSDIFRGSSLAGGVGPGFQWNILNYGRIANSVRAEDARFKQAVIDYQNTVLMANKEVEDAIVSFLHEQERVESLDRAVHEIEQALRKGLRLYDQGVIDYQRVLDSQRTLVLQQDTLAESRGKIAMNLVAVYKAIGGGWRMRYAPDAPLSGQVDTPFQEEAQPDDHAPLPAEPLPVPSAPPAGPPNAGDPARPQLNEGVQLHAVPNPAILPETRD